jgi:hypothetical protein
MSPPDERPSDARLAPELWDLAGSFCDLPALNSLSWVSKYLLATLRPRLYREVVLHVRPRQSRTQEETLGPEGPFLATLTLLGAQKDIAASIRSLRMFKPIRPWTPARWDERLFDAVANMTSLTALRLPYPLCGSPEMQGRFFHLLSRLDSPISLEFKIWKESVPLSKELPFPKLERFSVMSSPTLTCG